MSNATSQLGIISAGEAYPLRIFLPRVGLKDWAWRSAKRSATAAGITLDRKVGSTSWVRGDDWLAYLETLGARDGGGDQE